MNGGRGTASGAMQPCTEPQAKSRNQLAPVTASEAMHPCTNHSSKVAEIRQSFPLAPYISPHTNGLKQSRKRPHFFTGHCPFHNGDKRTFWVNTDVDVCGCFVPRCQGDRPPMDVINVYARLNNLTNGQALTELWHKLHPPPPKPKVQAIYRFSVVDELAVVGSLNDAVQIALHLGAWELRNSPLERA